MKFEELITLRPSLKLGELIQLFLLGYDDKIYFDIIINGDLYNPMEHIRIIDVSLEPYYDCEIEYLCDTEDSMLTVGIKKEEKDDWKEG